MEAEKDVDGLIEALGDDDWNTRYLAATVLGAIGDARAVEPLITALSNEDWKRLPATLRQGPYRLLPHAAHLHVCQTAAAALGTIGDARAVEPLITALSNEDLNVRKGAAKALGMIGDARAVEPLITALKQGRSDTVPFLEKMPPAAVGAEYERLELYDDAEEWYTSHGMLEEAAAARRKKAEMGAAKVSQKVVHGDEITKTEIKDSVVSKSNVGGGSSKMQELKELTEMKKEGLITDEEFEKMKRNIIG
jgi:HEAT repeat protein